MIFRKTCMYTPYHYLLAITRLNKDCEKKNVDTPNEKWLLYGGNCSSIGDSQVKCHIFPNSWSIAIPIWRIFIYYRIVLYEWYYMISHFFQVFGSYLAFCGIGLKNAQLYEKSLLENRRNQVWHCKAILYIPVHAMFCGIADMQI